MSPWHEIFSMQHDSEDPTSLGKIEHLLVKFSIFMRIRIFRVILGRVIFYRQLLMRSDLSSRFASGTGSFYFRLSKIPQTSRLIIVNNALWKVSGHVIIFFEAWRIGKGKRLSIAERKFSAFVTLGPTHDKPHCISLDLNAWPNIGPIAQSVALMICAKIVDDKRFNKTAIATTSCSFWRLFSYFCDDKISAKPASLLIAPLHRTDSHHHHLMWRFAQSRSGWNRKKFVHSLSPTNFYISSVCAKYSSCHWEISSACASEKKHCAREFFSRVGMAARKIDALLNLPLIYLFTCCFRGLVFPF